jgi:hypothetical protein
MTIGIIYTLYTNDASQEFYALIKQAFNRSELRIHDKHMLKITQTNGVRLDEIFIKDRHSLFFLNKMYMNLLGTFVNNHKNYFS